jgi:transposase
MSKKPVTTKAEAEKAVKDIRRATRKVHSAEEKIRIVLAGLRGEDSIAELCRREGIAQSLYYSWSKEFLEAGQEALGRGYGPPGNQHGGEGPARRVSGLSRRWWPT